MNNKSHCWISIIIILITKTLFSMEENCDEIIIPKEFQDIILATNGEIQSLAGGDSFNFSFQLAPKNSFQVKRIIKWAIENELKITVASGNFTDKNGFKYGLSLGAHAQGEVGAIVLSTINLKSHKNDYWINDEDQTISIRVGAGTSWKEAIKIANSTLTKNEATKFSYHPITAPTSSMVSIAGNIASHGHSRTSLFVNGYAPEFIDSFELVTRVKNKIKKLFVSREENSNLFFAIPGSFGRGGIITAVTLRLQKVSKKTKVIMEIEKFTGTPYDFAEKFLEEIKNILEDLPQGDDYFYQRPFRACCATQSSSGNYFIYRSRLCKNKEVSLLPYFNPFENHKLLSNSFQKAIHKHPNFSNKLVETFMAPNNGNIAKYKNHKDAWIFMQDSYPDFFRSKQCEISHQAYVIPGQILGDALSIIDEERENLGIKSKLEDIVPLPTSPFIMAPVSNIYDNSEINFVYTFTWPILKPEDRIKLKKFKLLLLMRFEEEFNEHLIKPHMLKEFEPYSLLLSEYYQEQARILEDRLLDHNINDDFINSKIIDALYMNRYEL